MAVKRTAAMMSRLRDGQPWLEVVFMLLMLSWFLSLARLAFLERRADPSCVAVGPEEDCGGIDHFYDMIKDPVAILSAGNKIFSNFVIDIFLASC